MQYPAICVGLQKSVGGGVGLHYVVSSCSAGWDLVEYPPGDIGLSPRASRTLQPGETSRHVTTGWPLGDVPVAFFLWNEARR